MDGVGSVLAVSELHKCEKERQLKRQKECQTSEGESDSRMISKEIK